MSYFKAWYVVAVIVSLIAAAIFLVMFRPDLLPYASWQSRVKALMEYIPGQTSSDTLLRSKSKTVTTTTGADQVPVKKDMYLIELKSGGRVYTDNLKAGDGKLSYETDKGLVIEIHSYEVIGVHKYKEGEEPGR